MLQGTSLSGSSISIQISLLAKVHRNHNGFSFAKQGAADIAIPLAVVSIVIVAYNSCSCWAAQPIFRIKAAADEASAL